MLRRACVRWLLLLVGLGRMLRLWLGGRLLEVVGLALVRLVVVVRVEVVLVEVGVEVLALRGIMALPGQMEREVPVAVAAAVVARLSFLLDAGEMEGLAVVWLRVVTRW